MNTPPAPHPEKERFKIGNLLAGTLFVELSTLVARIILQCACENPCPVHGHADMCVHFFLPVPTVVVGKTLERVLRLKNNNDTAVAFKVKVHSTPPPTTPCELFCMKTTCFGVPMMSLAECSIPAQRQTSPAPGHVFENPFRLQHGGLDSLAAKKIGAASGCSLPHTQPKRCHLGVSRPTTPIEMQLHPPSPAGIAGRH